MQYVTTDTTSKPAFAKFVHQMTCHHYKYKRCNVHPKWQHVVMVIDLPDLETNTFSDFWGQIDGMIAVFQIKGYAFYTDLTHESEVT